MCKQIDIKYWVFRTKWENMQTVDIDKEWSTKSCWGMCKGVDHGKFSEEIVNLSGSQDSQIPC